MTPDLLTRLMRDGYHAILDDRRARGGTGDRHLTRLLGRQTLVVRGRAGARMFYDDDLVQRRGAVPPPLGWLLFGRGAIHSLDGSAHRERKAMFLDLLAPSRVEELVTLVDRRLGERLDRYDAGDRLTVFDALVEVYGECVLEWVGVDCSTEDAHRLAHELAALIDGFGGAGAAYPRAWLARRRTQRVAQHLVRTVRDSPASADPDRPLAMIAVGPGRDLTPHAAAVELLNLVRPTVAVAWLSTLAALALDAHPTWRARLAPREADRERIAFAHEVRRLYPFVPALAGRLKADMSHHGRVVRAGRRLLLDVRGTHVDAAVWPDPETFAPERFLEHDPGAYDLLAQGGGEVTTGHRCPGEPLTVRLMAVTLRHLARVDHEVVSSPDYDERRIPTLPRDGLRVEMGDSAGVGQPV
ncbi:cytochrome P450 [Nocardioides sp.]|uniref:cytochrome P450 n=1 Tax=Nocardioides sp. TaxID=35761 RepID=UPI0027328E00|nr:cytochrome P450 [Nocardioides sp.]MDP3892131.1 cytochrome P450 [Nocardioides sp.]